MTLPIFWAPEAESEFVQARDRYRQIDPKLGTRFELAVGAAMDAIARNPLWYQPVYRQFRRAGVRRFPYGIFFEVDQDRIVVVACFHSKRHPQDWQSR